MVPGERGGAGRRREAAQRLLRLRVSQQVEERDDDPAHLRGRDGDDRRRGRKQGRAGDGAQRGDVVVEQQQRGRQRRDDAGEAVPAEVEVDERVPHGAAGDAAGERVVGEDEGRSARRRSSGGGTTSGRWRGGGRRRRGGWNG